MSFLIRGCEPQIMEMINKNANWSSSLTQFKWRANVTVASSRSGNNMSEPCAVLTFGIKNVNHSVFLQA
jgi:hypothetical protein